LTAGGGDCTELASRSGHILATGDWNDPVFSVLRVLGTKFLLSARVIPSDPVYVIGRGIDSLSMIRAPLKESDAWINLSLWMVLGQF
jgi:predicted phosphatase